jgi:hypothetical protein
MTAPKEFWDLLHEWSETQNDERTEWIEHRFNELFALATTPKVEAALRAPAPELDPEAPPWLLSADVAMRIGNEHRVRVGAVQAIAKAVHAADPDTAQAPAVAVPVAMAWHYWDGKPCTLTWAGEDEARMEDLQFRWTLIKRPLYATPQPPAQPQAQGDALREALLELLIARADHKALANLTGQQYDEAVEKWVARDSAAAIKARAALSAPPPAQAAEAPEGFNRATALALLSAASKSGHAGAIKLAAQLAGAAPCDSCGYVNFHCRCAASPSGAPSVRSRDEG